MRRQKDFEVMIKRRPSGEPFGLRQVKGYPEPACAHPLDEGHVVVRAADGSSYKVNVEGVGYWYVRKEGERRLSNPESDGDAITFWDATTADFMSTVGRLALGAGWMVGIIIGILKNGVDEIIEMVESAINDVVGSLRPAVRSSTLYSLLSKRKEKAEQENCLRQKEREKQEEVEPRRRA